jgi:hypothetical protein
MVTHRLPAERAHQRQFSPDAGSVRDRGEVCEALGLSILCILPVDLPPQPREGPDKEQGGPLPF